MPGVLLAISAGDMRRQREFDAGQHLLDCEVCATLSEPLDRRSIALTAIVIPAGLAAWAAGKVRTQPVQTTAAAGAGAAAVAAVAVALSLSPHHSVPEPAPTLASSASAPAPAVISGLFVGGQAVPDAEAGQSLTIAGRPRGDRFGATVVDAVTRNGFWIGTPRAHVWVELVGPLRALRVQPGDRVWFTGVVVSDSTFVPGPGGSDRQQCRPAGPSGSAPGGEHNEDLGAALAARARFSGDCRWQKDSIAWSRLS